MANNDKNIELPRHCSIAAIACTPAQCAKAIASPEFRRKSPLDHKLDHYHLPHQSYHHLDQSFENENIFENNNNYSNQQLDDKFKTNRNLKRSATLAECNWPPIEDIKFSDYHHAHFNDESARKLHDHKKRTAAQLSNKKLTNSIANF